MVNFKDNLIDYPCSKDYLNNFLIMIRDKNIIDENLFKVYQIVCDNMEKCQLIQRLKIILFIKYLYKILKKKINLLKFMVVNQ